MHNAGLQLNDRFVGYIIYQHCPRVRRIYSGAYTTRLQEAIASRHTAAVKEKRKCQGDAAPIVALRGLSQLQIAIKSISVGAHIIIVIVSHRLLVCHHLITSSVQGLFDIGTNTITENSNRAMTTILLVTVTIARTSTNGSSTSTISSTDSRARRRRVVGRLRQ
jgi:hypothetical protein